LTEEDLSVEIARYEDKRNTATILEEPTDGLHEKQKYGRIYSRR
jgi:hypothetical protein